VIRIKTLETNMQDPNADTEWNDALRKHGIIPEKKEVEIKEEDIIKMMDDAITNKVGGKKLEDMTSEELEEQEDEDWDDEGLINQIRQQRLGELRAEQKLSRFGDVREISAIDYVEQVNKAGEGIWVILHLFKSGIPLCELINAHLERLAPKFPKTKFLKSVSTTCIPNYPDKNLPTIFVYLEGEMKTQLAGPHTFGGMSLKIDDLEWMLSKSGSIESKLKSDPRGLALNETDGFSMLTRASRTRKDSESDDDDY